jgi:membrane protease YdiL (CAAX protease family)
MLKNRQLGIVEALIVFFVSLLLVVVLGMLWYGKLPNALLMVLIQIGGMFLPPIVWVLLTRRSLVRSLSLRKPRPGSWKLVFHLLPLMCLAAAAISVLQPLVLGAPPDSMKGMEKELMEMAKQIGILIIPLLTVMPGLCEELLCRGLLVTAFARRLSPFVSALIAALLFALMHFHPWRFFPQFLLGIVLGLVLIRCRSVYPAMVLHACYNFGIILTFAALMPFGKPRELGQPGIVLQSAIAYLVLLGSLAGIYWIFRRTKLSSPVQQSQVP